MLHMQRLTKVNMAVDIGVERLVAALSKIDRLCTLESCEGTTTELGFVLFRLLPVAGGKPEDLDLLETIRTLIESLEKTESYYWAIKAEWVYGRSPVGRIVFKAGCQNDLSSRISKAIGATDTGLGG